ncbi:MAG: 1-O-methyltransferase [Verrucomicrobiota bacterium]|jgi:hypothetical protein
MAYLCTATTCAQLDVLEVCINHYPVISLDSSNSDVVIGLEPVAEYLRISATIHGWLRGEGALEMARVVSSLPDNCVVVEIGCFLGSASILLAGVRRVRGSGKVHCVDPFDCTGDQLSAPIYSQLLTEQGEKSPRQCFDENIRAASLTNWIEVHEGRAEEVVKTWVAAIDLLFLDGDQSPNGARRAYDDWSPFIKTGGIIAIHNSADREYAADHDGSRLLALEELCPPRYSDVRLCGATHFAKKLK